MPLTDYKETLPSGISFEMVFVKGGTSELSKHSRKAKLTGETHTLEDFYIGKYPVTNAEFASFLNAYGRANVIGGQFKGNQLFREHEWGIVYKKGKWIAAEGFENYPVIRISWVGAVEYCRWLSEVTRFSYRLPTEAEWEYAAMGGKPKATSLYSGSRRLEEVAWFSSNSYGQTHEVGLKFPNELGLYDMSGNVNEWCGIYSKYEEKPSLEHLKMKLVIRGGSWRGNREACQISHRHVSPSQWSRTVGFRIAVNG